MEAFDRILANHISIARSATITMGIARPQYDGDAQHRPSGVSRFNQALEVIYPIPFIATIPPVLFAGVASKPARMCRSTRPFDSVGGRTSSRALGRRLDRSASRVASPAATALRCALQCLMEKSMLGHAGFLRACRTTRSRDDRCCEGYRTGNGIRPILRCPRRNPRCASIDARRHENRLHLLRGRLQLRRLDERPAHFKIEPEQGPVNGISTCVKGKFGWDFIDTTDRFTAFDPRRKKFREASWEEALDLVAEGSRKSNHSMGRLDRGRLSSKCTNEESYLYRSWPERSSARTTLITAPAIAKRRRPWACFVLSDTAGTQLDCRHRHGDLGVDRRQQYGRKPSVLATRVKQAHSCGQKLIVADLRKHEMARRADIFMRPRPSTDIVWLCAVTRYIIDQDLHNTDFINEWVNRFEAISKSLEPFTLEFAERITGIPAPTLETVARIIAKEERVCALWAMGTTQHCNGSDTSTALSNLLLVTNWQ